MAGTPITIFDGFGDFSLLKTRFLAHLSVIGLKDVVILKPPSPPLTEEEEADLEKRKKRDADEAARLERCDKAKNVIFLNVADKVLRKIELCETAAEAWTTLDRLFMIRSLRHRVFTQLSFYTFKMQENKKIDENIDDFLKIVADLNHLQIDVTDEVQAILLLSSLPSRYDGLVETMKYSNSREKLRLDDVMVVTRDKERELSQNNRSVAEGHFARGRQEGSYNNQANKGKGRARSKSRDGKKVCWICGKEGHFKKQCYKWLERNKDKSQSSDKRESSIAKGQEKKDPAMVLMAESETLVVTGSNAEEWVLDTGCSFHMTPRRDWFIEFKELSTGYEKMGNDTYSQVKGIGNIKVRNSDGTQVILTDVRYMPSMSRNLISLGTLEDKGCWFKSKDGILKVVKGCSTVLKRSEERYSIHTTRCSRV